MTYMLLRLRSKTVLPIGVFYAWPVFIFDIAVVDLV